MYIADRILVLVFFGFSFVRDGFKILNKIGQFWNAQSCYYLFCGIAGVVEAVVSIFFLWCLLLVRRLFIRLFICRIDYRGFVSQLVI